jgi:PAS domain S-box-containing protein
MEQTGVTTSSSKPQVALDKSAEDVTLANNLPTQLEQALLLIEPAFAGVALLDNYGHLVWVNEGFVELLTLGPSEVLGQKIWEILPPKHSSEATSFSPPTVLTTQSALEYEGQVAAATGAAYWLRAKIQPAPLHQPARFFVLLEDITAWKAAQLSAQKREIQLQHLIEQVPGVLFQWRDNYDGTSHLTYCSDSSRQLFGFKPNQLISLQEVVHPDDQAAWTRFWRPANGIVEARTFTGRLLVPDQPVRWCQADCQPSATDTEGVLYSGILQDVTALQEAEEAVQDSEQRWHLAIERFGDGAWEFNYQTGDDYFSNAYRAMLGSQS